MALLVACQRDAPGSGTAPAVPSLPAAQLAWEGELACADCDGIETRLVLQRGAADDYTLTETYLAEDGNTRFVEHGRWRRAGSLLRLRGDSGESRVYGLVAGGRLQPRDGHGRPFVAYEEDLLDPVEAAESP